MARTTVANGASFRSALKSHTAQGGSNHQALSDAGRWPVVAAMVVAVSMPMLGILGAGPALPGIQRDLGARGSEMRWIVDSYLLGFAGLVLAGGCLADRFGRKRLFLWSCVLFILGSAAGGLADTPGQLILARGAMGMGAGLLVPATLANTAAVFDGKGRAAAMGLWSGVSAIALLYGPLAGAYLVQRYSWDSVLLINVPVVMVALVLGAVAAKGPGSTDGDDHLDPAGIMLGSAVPLLLAYGLLEGNFRGWRDELVTGSLGLAAALLTLWLVRRSRRSRAMPSGLLEVPASSASHAVTAAAFFTLFGTGFLLTAYLQDVLGYSPGEAATLLFPFAGLALILAPFAGRVSHARESRGLMTLGSFLSAAGLGLLLRTGPGSSYEAAVLPALILLGSGMGLITGSLATAVLPSADAPRQGLASGLTNTFRILGVLLGIALLGTVVGRRSTKASSSISLRPALPPRRQDRWRTAPDPMPLPSPATWRDYPCGCLQA